MTSLCISRAICEPWTSVSDFVVFELCYWNLYLNYEIVRPYIQWLCFNGYLILFYAHVTYWKLQAIWCQNIMDMLYAAQNPLSCYKNSGLYWSYIHAAKIWSHTGYTSKQKGCLIPTALRHIFHTNYKYILDNRFNAPCHTKDTGSIQYVTYNISTAFAYFNTTATTNKMANTKNVTFRHPHTRQMQLPMPFLFLTTISFTLFTFSSMLSILSTSSGTSVVKAATMVEDNHYLEGTPHILPRTNTWNMSPASKLQQQAI